MSLTMATTSKTTNKRVTPKKKKPDPTTELVINIRDLTRRETAEIETLTKRPMKDLFFDDGTPSAELNTVITYLRLRENHPDITLDEVFDMPVTADIKVIGAPTPTKAGGSKSSRP